MLRHVSIVAFVYAFLLAISFLCLFRVSGGDLALRLFSILLLAFYAIVLFAVASFWNLKRIEIILGLLICLLLRFVVVGFLVA